MYTATGSVRAGLFIREFRQLHKEQLEAAGG